MEISVAVPVPFLSARVCVDKSSQVPLSALINETGKLHNCQNMTKQMGMISKTFPRGARDTKDTVSLIKPIKGHHSPKITHHCYLTAH